MIVGAANSVSDVGAQVFLHDAQTELEPSSWNWNRMTYVNDTTHHSILLTTVRHLCFELFGLIITWRDGESIKRLYGLSKRAC